MRVRILNTAGWEKTFRLTEAVTLVGSDAGNAIQLLSPEIAPLQLQFIRNHADPPSYSLYNFSGSINILRGEQTIPLPEQSMIGLIRDDVILLGAYRLFFETSPENQTPPHPASAPKTGRNKPGWVLIPLFLIAILAIFAHLAQVSGWKHLFFAAPQAGEPTEQPVIQLKKFSLWVRPVSEIGKSNAENPVNLTGLANLTREPSPVEEMESRMGFSEKYAELVLDPAVDEGYRLINYSSQRQLRMDEPVLLEWEIGGADVVHVDPFADEALPPAGTRSFLLSGPVNLVLTAANGEVSRSFLLPVTVGEPVPLTAPEITFFEVSPASISRQRDVVLSWSVTGKATRIQLFSSAYLSAGSGKTTATPTPNPSFPADQGTLLADDLPLSGFLSVNVKQDTVFILKAWNDSLSSSAQADVKVTRLTAALASPVRTMRLTTVVQPQPTKTSPVLKKIGLEIRAIQPDGNAYINGETITVYTGFSGVNETDRYPAGTVLISDGISGCTITLPRNSCELTLMASGQTALTARYSGDSFYQPVIITGPAISIGGKQTPGLRISGLSPKQPAYTIGDSVDVFVEISAPQNNQPFPSGRVKVTNGFSSCLLTVGSATHCRLPLTDLTAGRIVAEYAGDSIYAAVSSDPVNIQIVGEQTLIPTFTPQPTPTAAPVGSVLLEIKSVLPDVSSYTTGETVSVFIGITPRIFENQQPTGTILISDGTANCTVQLPRTSCSLPLASSGNAALTAEYSGDSNYQPAEAQPRPISIQRKKVPELEITGIFPEQAIYQAGSSVSVYVSFENENFDIHPPRGFIRVANGTASCMISAGSDTNCTLPLPNASRSEITAEYAGDDIYAAVSSAPVTIQVAEDLRIQTKTRISGLVPDKPIYEIGEEIYVYVNVTPEKKGPQSLTGTVLVTDGYSSCTVDTNKENFCNLKLINSMISKIEAYYSGDSVYAGSASDPFPVRISMVEIEVAIQAMTYSTCDSPQPDPAHVIQAQTDQSVSPVLRYFSLDSSFMAGGGFYANVTLTAKSGQFASAPGTVSAKLCHKDDPDYCLITQPVPLTRDPSQPGRAKATLEFPLVQRAGNFRLEIEYEGDSVSFAGEKAGFDVRGVHKGFLILTPEGVFDPADESLSGYRWKDLIASSAETDTVFDAYYLKGGRPACPVKLDAPGFESPRPFSLDIRVADSVFGAASPDADWQAALEASGNPARIVAELQPNAMNWGRSSCNWQAPAGFWQLNCRNSGIMEPSVITYFADIQDLNYTVKSPGIPIEVSIGKYLSMIDTGNLRNTLRANGVYWLNFRNDHFDIDVRRNCLSGSPVRTVSSFLTGSNGNVTDSVINLTAYVASRAKIDAIQHLPAVTAPIEIHLGSGSGMITVEPSYFGFTASGEITDFGTVANIKNKGCELSSDGSAIMITAAAGTLSGGRNCDEGGKERVNSSFCQLRFSSGADGLPVTLRYAGNDEVSEAVTDINLSVGPSGSGLLQADTPQLLAEMIPTPQTVSITPAFIESETGYPVYDPAVGIPYTLRLTSGTRLDDQVSLTANWPEIFNPANLDPAGSTCLNYLHPDSGQFIIPGSEFSVSDSDPFQCFIVFSRPVNLSVPQTMHFDLDRDKAAGYFQMAPFSWNGIPSSVHKRELTHLLTISDENGPLCTSLNPVCGTMLAGDIYRLTYQVPAFADQSSGQLLDSLSMPEAIGPGIITWPENWANAIRSAQLSGAAADVEDLCEIDSNGQTIFSLEPNLGQNFRQAFCNFVVTDLQSAGPVKLMVKNDARLFAFQDVELPLPDSLQRREVALTPSLLLRLDPADGTAPAESLVNYQLTTLYRSNNPMPVTRPGDSDIAEYTLLGTVSGIPAGRSPLWNDRLLVRWDLLDLLSAMGELPDCFMPDDDGNYRVGVLSESGPGSWSADCAFRIPASVDTDAPVGPIEMFVETSAFQKSVRIASPGQPFQTEIIRGFVTPPPDPVVFRPFTLMLDLNTAAAPLSDYAKALLRTLDLFPADIRWAYLDLLSCEPADASENAFRRSCSFRFDSVPEDNPETVIYFAPLLPGLENLLQVEFYSAATNTIQDTYPVAPVSAANLTVQTTLRRDGVDLPLPAAETDGFELSADYALSVIARDASSDESLSGFDLSGVSAVIQWPLLAHPSVGGSCVTPSGELILPFSLSASTGAWAAGCDFRILRGDFVLSEAEKYLSVAVEAPGFVVAYEPAEQIIRMPAEIHRVPSGLSIGPLYQTGAPDIQFPSSLVPVDMDLSVDILFTGDAAAFDPGKVSVFAGAQSITGCTAAGTLVTCRIPAGCTDEPQLTGDSSYPEICSEEITIRASYPGDSQNDPAEVFGPGYRITRETVQFSLPPVNGFSADLLKKIWQSTEDGQDWQIAAVSNDGWSLDTYLIRDVRSASALPAAKVIPVYVSAVPSGGVSSPDETLFFLDILYLKSENGLISENMISLRPRFYNPLDGSLEFVLDFADPAILEDGSAVFERFAEMVRIERMTICYAGDPAIAASEMVYQPENLHYPLYLVTLIEQTLQAAPDRLSFEAAVGLESTNTNFDIFCSQPVYQLNCYPDLSDTAAPESMAPGCWGNLNTGLTFNPSISASPVISPRCYLFGINRQSGYDQLWLSDSENDGL